MAASSGVRTGSRSPPFLVIGLCVALCILGFYYWNLSSRNTDLAFEVEQLRSSLRVETSKRIKTDERAETVLASLKECEDTEHKDKSIINAKETDLRSLTDQLHGKEEELKNVQKKGEECAGSLTQCQTDTSGIREELQKLKDDSNKREQELQSLKSAAENKCDCTAALQEQRKEIEAILSKAVGPQAVQALNQNGIVKNEPAQEQHPNPSVGQHDQPQKPAVGFEVPGFHPQANLPRNLDFHPPNWQAPSMGRSFDQRNELIKKDAAEVVDGEHGVDAGKAEVDGGGKPPSGGVAAEVKEARDVDEAEAVEQEKNPRYDKEDDEDDDGDVVGKELGKNEGDTDLAEREDNTGQQDTTTQTTAATSQSISPSDYEEQKVIDETKGGGDVALKFQPAKRDDGIERLQRNLQNE